MSLLGSWTVSIDARCASAAATATAITATGSKSLKKFRPIMLSLAQKVSGYAGRCAEGLWPSGKYVLLILGYAQFVGAEPQIFSVIRNGSAERFRTSGGRAAA